MNGKIRRLRFRGRPVDAPTLAISQRLIESYPDRYAGNNLALATDARGMKAAMTLFSPHPVDWEAFTNDELSSRIAWEALINNMVSLGLASFLPGR